MGIMVNTQVVLRDQSGSPTGGLRSRKKAKTRLAIEDAALSLFEGQGYEATTVEEIAERAEVSVTTFFRYFPTKAEVLLSDHGEQLPALHRSIVERPQGEDDLLAIQRAVQLEWVAAIDPERTARKTRIVDRSDQLVGMSYHRGHRWYAAVTEALARRRGLDIPDDRCIVTARVALGILASAVEGWMAAGCLGDLTEAVDRQFDLAKNLCAEWSSSTRARE
jgi:AcrR family transcriptional regulator